MPNVLIVCCQQENDKVLNDCINNTIVLSSKGIKKYDYIIQVYFNSIFNTVYKCTFHKITQQGPQTHYYQFSDENSAVFSFEKEAKDNVSSIMKNIIKDTNYDKIYIQRTSENNLQCCEVIESFIDDKSKIEYNDRAIF